MPCQLSVSKVYLVFVETSQLPDLSLNIVLADTSSDECSTEPDSAGETTHRRQNLRK